MDSKLRERVLSGVNRNCRTLRQIGNASAADRGQKWLLRQVEASLSVAADYVIRLPRKYSRSNEVTFETESGTQIIRFDEEFDRKEVRAWLMYALHILDGAIFLSRPSETELRQLRREVLNLIMLI